MKRPSHAIVEFWRLSAAAKQSKIPRSTLQQAVESGRLPSQQTACGLALVHHADLVAFQRKYRKGKG